MTSKIPNSKDPQPSRPSSPGTIVDSQKTSENKKAKATTSRNRTDHFWYWLFFPDILMGLLVTVVISSTPVLINFHSLLTDCARQRTFEGCMAADSNDDTTCIWNATESTCSFADNFDCSAFSNNSVQCTTDPTSMKYCLYRFGAGKGACIHKSGWTDSQTGMISAFSVMGGLFGPFIMQRFANWQGYARAIVIIGILIIVSSIVFAIGIADGQNFAMYCVSRVLASITAFSGPYLYPSFLTDNSPGAVAAAEDEDEEECDDGHHHNNITSTAVSTSASPATFHQDVLPQASPLDSGSIRPEQAAIHREPDHEIDQSPSTKEQNGEEPKQMTKYFIVSSSQRTLHVRCLGTAAALLGLALSIYLYFVSPDGNELAQSGLATASMLKFTRFVDLKTTLQVFNVAQFVVGFSLLAFAYLIVKYESMMVEVQDDEPVVAEEPEETESVDSEMEKKVMLPAVSPGVLASAEVQISYDEENQEGKIETNQHQEKAQHPHVVVATAVVEAPPNPLESMAVVAEVKDFLLPPPCSPPCTTRNAVLLWIGAVCMPIVLQMSGQIAIISYTPIVMGDVINNALLAQIVVACPMPVGAVLSLAVLGKYFSPLQLYIVCGAGCSVACMIIGIGLYLPTTVTDGSYHDQSAGLTLFGLVAFSFLYASGPGTVVFAAMMEEFYSVDLPKIPTKKEFAKMIAQVAQSPEQKRFEEKRQQEYKNDQSPSATAAPSPIDELHQQHHILHMLHMNENYLLSLGVSISGCWSCAIQFVFRFAFPVFTTSVYPSDVRVGRAIAFFGFAVVSFLANVLLVITQRARGRGVGAPKAVVKITDALTCSSNDEN